ncbi:unnamed protein product, partial [Prorocentrum cordatum]
LTTFFERGERQGTCRARAEELPLGPPPLSAGRLPPPLCASARPEAKERPERGAVRGRWFLFLSRRSRAARLDRPRVECRALYARAGPTGRGGERQAEQGGGGGGLLTMWIGQLALRWSPPS